MFPDYHLMRALVADRRSHFEEGARTRRLLRGGRRSQPSVDGAAPTRSDRSTTAVEAIPAAARQALPLERTPSETHRAA